MNYWLEGGNGVLTQELFVDLLEKLRSAVDGGSGASLDDPIFVS